MLRIIKVDPGVLRLPPGRQDGSVVERYFDQVQKFQGNTAGMPLVQVTEGKGGELMINDGVTRAVRIHNLSAGKLLPVEVIDVRYNADFSRLKRVRDVPPPQEKGT